MGLTDEHLRHHEAALLEVWIGLVDTLERIPDSKFKALWWHGLDRLDQVLEDLLPTLDPESTPNGWSPSTSSTASGRRGPLQPRRVDQPAGTAATPARRKPKPAVNRDATVSPRRTE